MVEISLETLSLCMVFSAYGAFRFGNDLFNLCMAKKWLWIPLLIVLVVASYFVFLKGYGKWFTLNGF